MVQFVLTGFGLLNIKRAWTGVGARGEGTLSIFWQALFILKEQNKINPPQACERPQTKKEGKH